jgi:two-component system sensor histidine kinase UhpB
VELVIYRVAQESVTNAIRHSNADTISVWLEGDPDFVALRVRDDGDGMPRELPSGTSGISGMRERALLVGGRFAIEAVPTRGTEVRLMIPLGSERA